MAEVQRRYQQEKTEWLLIWQNKDRAGKATYK